VKPFPLIITDLDATLLDHETYSWQPASEALAALRARSIPLVLNSSKTRPEIELLRTELGNRHPFVVENGAAVLTPVGYFREPAQEPPGDDYELERFGAPRQTIVREIRRLRSERDLAVEGFSDWTVAQIAERTGLPLESAARAADRCCSEPTVFSGDSASLEWFQSELERVGLRTLQGGRFLHVTGRFDKADGVRRLRERYSAEHPDQEVVVIALGDSPNDQGMLDAADVAVIVRSPRSERLQVSKPRRILRTELPGPSGWNQAVGELLDEFD